MDRPRTTFTVDVTLHPASLGGRTAPTPTGWYDCVCKLTAEEWPRWSCRLLVHGVGLVPGETRLVPVLLPEPECGALVAAAGRFLLWEGGHGTGAVVGEASVVGRADPRPDDAPSDVAMARALVAGYDVTAITRRAGELLAAGRPRQAVKLFLFLADGDPSLEAGWLAERIGRCCEMQGDLHMARWWYGRAVEENPCIGAYVEARHRLDAVRPDLPPSDAATGLAVRTGKETQC